MADVRIINRFPDWYAPGFDENRWNSQFITSNVIINSDVYEADYPEHWGPLSLKFAYGGSEYYETDNCQYRVSDGKFLLMNEDQTYSSSIKCEKTRSFSINFCPEYRRERLAELIYSDSDMLDDPALKTRENMDFFTGLYEYDENFIREINNLKGYIDGLNYGTLFLNEKLSIILKELMILHSEKLKKASEVKSVKYSTRLEVYRRLKKAKDYIESNYSEHVSLDDIGKTVGMNPHHMLRKFKELYQTTPHQYLTKIRLTEAKKLVRNGNNSITDICLNVGFEDPASFSKLFKKTFGESPDHYRKKNFFIRP